MTRGFPPSRIQAWALKAHELAEHDETVDVALVIAYSAWEALQGRVLSTALRRQGYSLKVGHAFLGQSRLNDGLNMRQLAPIILGQHPHQMRDVGREWKAVEAWSKQRNGLVHGLTTYSPTELRAAVAEVAARVLAPMWLATMRVPTELGGSRRHTVALGDVLIPQRTGRLNGLTAEQLAAQVRELRGGGRSPR